MVEVEAPEDEALELLLECRASLAGGEHERVALEQAGLLLVAHVAGAARAPAREAFGFDDADALAGLRQFGVDALDVRLFDRDLAGDLVGQFVDLAGRTSLNRAHAVLPLAVLAHRAARG